MQVRRWRERLLAPSGLLVLGAYSCGPERQVLERPDYQGVATGGGAGQESTSAPGISKGGRSYGGFGTTGDACSIDADCSNLSVCVANECAFCGHASEECFPCPSGLEPVSFARNGCEACECAPRGECDGESSECPSAEVCYAGNFCQESCGEPWCCFNNRCGSPGCEGQPLPCVLGGCPGNGQCDHSCAQPFCECDGDRWRCFDSASSSAGASGAAGAGGADGAGDCYGVCIAR